MFCSKCGNEIPEGMQVCAFCGTPVNRNMNGEQTNSQQGVYKEGNPDYSGQNTSGNGYTNGTYQNNPNQSYNYANNNGYGTPQNMDGGATGLAIASLILGIIALLLGCCSPFKLVMFIIAALSIIFGILSIQKSQSGHGMAVAGIVCSIIGLVANIIYIVLGFGLLSAFFSYL